jgi:hypothetical protein
MVQPRQSLCVAQRPRRRSIPAGDSANARSRRSRQGIPTLARRPLGRLAVCRSCRALCARQSRRHGAPAGPGTYQKEFERLLATAEKAEKAFKTARAEYERCERALIRHTESRHYINAIA